jgi:molybdopterin molybdotransferase
MFRDVRMRGFKARADVDEVVAWVDGLALAPIATTVLLEAAWGGVLAEDLVSEIDVPSFARSAMDGWALRGEDTLGASDTDPLAVRVVGSALPGRPHEGEVQPGQAVRIMTGAPLPRGADSVLRAEDGEQREDELQVRAAVPTGRHVGAPGEDVEAGATLLRTGRRLRPQDVGLASSIGRDSLRVFRAPAVEVLVTGTEVVPPGEARGGACVADADGPMLRALVERDGGSATLHYVPDDADALRARLTACRSGKAPVVLVTGGSSVGEEDHAPRLLHDLGELVFHGVAMRPAAPTGMGTMGAQAVFLLPGNPVSCLSAYDFFAGRLVRRLAGRDPAWPYLTRRVRLSRKIVSVLGRVDYARVVIEADGVRPLMTRGASILSSTTEADGFVVVPRDSEGHPEGAEVEVVLYG